ncbi:MAG: hypothetical protein F4X66_14190 [Chloroflexi bacterium]|nr:hypothetical protein [Chloroflexota bacterium]MYE42362.1 hypothetical protein [Chloroflexota bacterium]
MPSRPIRDLSEYPRPWFYRPEIYYAFIIFPPVWSILTLRSPWHKGEGFFGILIGGVAWFFLIASVVFTVRWVQADDEGNRQIVNLFIFVPGLLLTLVTQIQWAAHRAQHGPPPTDLEDEPESSASAGRAQGRTIGGDNPTDTQETGETIEPAAERPAPRRRRRRRRRPADRSADSATLC